MEQDPRYERDVYTWLATLELSQYYFLFKSAGYLTIRDILYLEEEDIENLGIDIDEDIRKIMIGIKHIAVPDKTIRDRRFPTAFQAGRIVVHMHQFLDYSQIVGNTCINKTFLYSLRTGIKTMTIVSPLKKNADFYNILYRFGGIKELSGRRFSPEGIGLFSKALVEITARRGGRSILRDLDLSGCDMGDEGSDFLSAALESGACMALQQLKLADNRIKLKGMQALARCIKAERLKRLTHFSLSGNPLGDAGLRTLAAAMASPNFKAMTHLSLARIQVTDKGVSDFASALKSCPMPDLEYLDLRDNAAVGDAGCVSMMTVVERGTPSLQVLRLRGCRCSTKVAKMFLSIAGVYFDLSV